ncbi:MAG TPA: hypothetical protein VFY29_21305 [Terriglobia bacterium]|nr:hypothetical protein [Terriglobia bacterium]
MVVLQRNDVGRTRLIYFLTIILSVVSFVVAATVFSASAQPVRMALLAWIVVAAAALVLSVIQLAGHPERSHALLLHLGDHMILATNALHESYKLRFLRDVLNDNITTFTDEDRARWKPLEDDGYRLALRIQNPRKILILRLCTMLFDDVFVIDKSNRWEHHDSSSTADPTFSSREMPAFRSWNGAL